MTKIDAHTLFCSNLDCLARGKINEGNITTHGTTGRYRCRTCDKTFRLTQGTVYEGLHYDEKTVTLVLSLLSHGCPRQAIVNAFEMDERTVMSWETRAGKQCEQVHEAMIMKQQLEGGHIQLDELRVVTANKEQPLAWVGSAIKTGSRLWVGGVVSATRDKKLAHDLMQVVFSCVALFSSLLLCFDGWPPYLTAYRKTFRYKIPRYGKVGRCAYEMWSSLVVGRLVKMVQGKWTMAKELVHGTTEQLSECLSCFQGGLDINTAFIERLNATFRQRLTVFTRRGRATAHKLKTLRSALYLVGTAYNFCTPHDSLRISLPEPLATTGQRWELRSPAMAEGLTDHVWTMKELLSYRVPPPVYVAPPAPKKRGRPKKVVTIMEETPAIMEERLYQMV